MEIAQGPQWILLSQQKYITDILSHRLVSPTHVLWILLFKFDVKLCPNSGETPLLLRVTCILWDSKSPFDLALCWHHKSVCAATLPYGQFQGYSDTCVGRSLALSSCLCSLLRSFVPSGLMTPPLSALLKALFVLWLLSYLMTR